MLSRLLSNGPAFFSIRLKGPLSQRIKRASGIRQEQRKHVQNFFKDYSPQTAQFYRNGFTQSELANTNSMVRRAFSLENATPQQILNYRIDQAVKKYQKHTLDCGNAAIQCAVMSERVILHVAHCKKYPKDKRAARKLTQLIEKRRNMLNYCMRTDYHRYKWVCLDYGIPDEHPKNAHHKETFGNFYNNYRTFY